MASTLRKFAFLIVSSTLQIIALAHGESSPGTLSNNEACRRWGHASALFDDIVYIYGGAAWHNKSDIGTRNSTANRDFVAMDLSRDFKIKNPPFTGLPVPPKPGPPKVLQGSFWVDEMQSKIIFYGGSFDLDPKNRRDTVENFTLWSYHPKTSLWSEEATSGETVNRASMGASAYYKGVGYYRGGQVDNLTMPGWPDEETAKLVLPGMLTYDFEKLSFSNKTEGFDVFGQTISQQYRDGSLVPITFGGRDLLVNFAGGAKTGTALPLSRVYIYDIEADKWFEQQVSGESPENTRSACAVVNYAPDNSSIQITVFGGRVWDGDSNSFVATNNMWILTIPSFTWISVGENTEPGSPGAKQEHTCHISGSQMIVIGGRNSTNVCDNGIWVFDTTKLKWQDSFTANTSYLVPNSVTAVIGGTSEGNASWNNLPVKRPTDVTSPFNDITGGSANSTIPEPPPQIQRVPAGAIAGGVVGGVVFLSAVVFTLWIFRRRHPKQHLGETPIPPPAADGPGEKNIRSGEKPLQDSDGLSELVSPTTTTAPRYSIIISPIEPAQLYGDSSFPVELYSPPPENGGRIIGPEEVYELSNGDSRRNTTRVNEESDNESKNSRKSVKEDVQEDAQGDAKEDIEESTNGFTVEDVKQSAEVNAKKSETMDEKGNEKEEVEEPSQKGFS
ncbi:hypothetical protein ABW19_dt0202719 [Dactylella cylindrospora]|nr:hypothetical protein ABW19_dt0202719 [Dactylella cylindrospora]